MEIILNNNSFSTNCHLFYTWPEGTESLEWTAPEPTPTPLCMVSTLARLRNDLWRLAVSVVTPSYHPEQETRSARRHGCTVDWLSSYWLLSALPPGGIRHLRCGSFGGSVLSYEITPGLSIPRSKEVCIPFMPFVPFMPWGRFEKWYRTLFVEGEVKSLQQLRRGLQDSKSNGPDLTRGTGLLSTRKEKIAYG